MKHKGKEVTKEGYDLYRKMGKDRKTYTDYLDSIDDYIDIVKGKTVLEIGPCHYFMTERIASHEPKSIVTIEPNSESVQNSIIPRDVVNHTVTADDYFHEFDTTFDVIFCVGVLYHLHSPLHLIEQICNNRPQTLILETTNIPADGRNDRDLILLLPESNTGIGGAGKSKGIKRQMPYKTLYPNEMHEGLIKGFGYKVIKKKHVATNHISKTNVFIWHFELDPSVTDAVRSWDPMIGDRQNYEIQR